MSVLDANILHLDLNARRVHLTDGEVVPIVNFYDDDGNDCDMDEAMCCVAGSDDYGWLTIDILEPEAVH